MSFVRKENPLPSGNSEKGTGEGVNPEVESVIGSILTQSGEKINRLEKFDLGRLRNVRGGGGQYTAACPAHDDAHNSLSVKIADDRVLLHCFAGCSVDAVTAAMGLEVSSLFFAPLKKQERRPKSRVKPTLANKIAYAYLLPDGSLSYRKMRYEYSDGSKSFAFFGADGKKGAGGSLRVPYNLPGVLAVGRVYFVEGEKAADAVNEAGRAATSLDAGANSKWLSYYDDYFAGKEVFILPDNDAAGMKYALSIAAKIKGAKIVSLPGLPDKGDVFDWLAAGRTMEEIDALPFVELPELPLVPDDPAYNSILPTESGFIAINPFENKQHGGNYRWDDIGISNLFADCYKNLFRFVPESKTWHFYDGRVWKPDTGGVKVAAAAKRFMYYLLVSCLGWIEDEERRGDWLDFVVKRMKKQSRDTMIADAQSCHPVHIHEFDCNPYMFNCQNCTLDLKTFTARGHSPDDFISKIAGAIYDEDAVCGRWDVFIDEIMCGDAETAKFLQKALGYALTGDTREECFFILYGSTTRNGKGTTMETALHLMGDYGRTAQPESIAQKQHSAGGAPSEDIARLKGARFVNMSEPDKGLRLNAALVKQVTGGDTVTARFLHQNSFEYRPEYKLFINTNHLPRVTDDSIFASNRVKLIPFERHFTEAEQNKGLKSLFKETENVSGILNWFLAGLKLMQAEGLNQPDSVRFATKQYREESDTVGLFVDERLTEVPHSKTTVKDVYTEYENWCGESGCSPLSKPNLTAELRRKGIRIAKSTKGSMYVFDYGIIQN